MHPSSLSNRSPLARVRRRFEGRAGSANPTTMVRAGRVAGKAGRVAGKAGRVAGKAGLALTLAASLVIAGSHLAPQGAVLTAPGEPSGIAYAQVLPPSNQGAVLATSKVITVTGTGQVQAAPDVAYVTLGAQAQAQTAQQAISSVSSNVSDIIAGVKNVGIPDNQIRTTSIDVNPIHQQPNPQQGPNMPPNPGPPPIVGYQASNQVQVTVNNLAQVGPVIDAAIKGGANLVGGVQFALRNDSTARQQALRQAVQSAQGDAQALADALGVQLTGVLAVEEQQGGRPSPGPMFAAAARSEVATPVQPGELTVQASVQIVYSHS